MAQGMDLETGDVIAGSNGNTTTNMELAIAVSLLSGTLGVPCNGLRGNGRHWTRQEWSTTHVLERFDWIGIDRYAYVELVLEIEIYGTPRTTAATCLPCKGSPGRPQHMPFNHPHDLRAVLSTQLETDLNIPFARPGPRTNRFPRRYHPSPSRVHGRQLAIHRPKRQGTRQGRRHFGFVGV
jgi:hypothetical protein